MFYKEEEVELQNKQFNLLEYFLLNKGTILLKEQIYDRIWGMESDATKIFILISLSLVSINTFLLIIEHIPNLTLSFYTFIISKFT